MQERPGGVRNTGLFENRGLDKPVTLAMDGGTARVNFGRLLEFGFNFIDGLNVLLLLDPGKWERGAGISPRIQQQEAPTSPGTE